jgi:bifunctional UDP-N-acetylglucosamine pyrophosphorylase / glucosamine-1-phosphate N-acetyltransferase
MNNIGGVILAAGKGTRMKSKTSNKVTLILGDKPMIVHAVEKISALGLHPIVVVVGFAKESVMELVKEDVIFAEQKVRLGTAHALKTGISSLGSSTEHVLVIQGDDSAFYKKELLENLIKAHVSENNSITFLTAEMDNPAGLGRIIRNAAGEVVDIVEEKNASEEIKKIKEINPACYVFSIKFLNKYLPKVKKNEVSGEYYLVDLIHLGIENNEKIQDVKGGLMNWRGVNTKEELEEAQNLYKDLR